MLSKIGAISEITVCPKCGSENIRNSSKHSKRMFLSAMFYQFYRCRVCHYQFERFIFSRLILGIVILICIITLLALTLLLSNQYASPEHLNKKIIDVFNKGDANAEFQVAMHYKGLDAQEAFRWFEQSARHGNVKAKYYYGLALFEGIGTIQNYKEGIFWLEEAAKAGIAKAQFTLGEIYYLGTGIPKNNARAYLWFNLSAVSNESSAGVLRDRIAGMLPLEQVNTLQEDAKKIATSSSYLSNVNVQVDN